MHNNFPALFHEKPILIKGNIHTVAMDVSPKLNQIARVCFELVYFETAVQHVSH